MTMTQEFSCCHAFQQCDYGRKECVFEESEPGKKERCRCYQLKRSKAYQSISKINKEVPVLISSFDEDEEGQLSLF